MFSTGKKVDKFAHSVVRHWALWVIAWIGLAVVCGWLPPSWSAIALDGDFDHLPHNLPSVEGDRLLDGAFPDNRTRSQMAIVLGRRDAELDRQDRLVSLDISRRMYRELAEVRLQRAMEQGWKPGDVVTEEGPLLDLLNQSLEALNQAIELDEQLFKQLEDNLPTVGVAPQEEPRLTIAYADRSVTAAAVGKADLAEADKLAVERLATAEKIVALGDRPKNPLSIAVDLLAPEDALVGHRLIKPKVQISILRLKTELGEAGNVPALKKVYEVIERAKAYTGSAAREGLTIQVTGSAAVGAETQRASDDAIRYTEVFTVLLVLLILAVVYRAPMLVSVPVVSIGIAVVIATGVIAWTIVGGRATGIPHPEVFVTSRIFVFVIVFGAGTDFCLFLIARLREEAGSADWNTAVSNSLSKTFGALVGSAMTTIVGLSTMILATFGKFYHTGPVISICLSITLLTCLTFTPALLRWMGPRVFWPSKPGAQHSGERLWVFVAQIVTRYPGTVLLFGSIGMLVPAVYGWQRQHAVTYDFVSQLSPSAPSRQAAELLATEFPAGETNPISVVVLAPQTSDKKQLQENIRALTAKLYVPGVSSVRSLVDPLGDTPPGQRVGVLARQDWRRRTLQNHAVARSYFISGEPEYAGRVARFDVIPLGDPFGTQAADTLDNLRKRMEEQVARADSGWFNASFAFSGTTASIQDLRSVTMKDTTEIQISVLIAVLIVLLFVVRRVWLSIYLIITVLVSYFATLGMTLLFFSWTGGDSFVGLDWKLPLFLFVILVAVGQDYNVYLVTRVLEEVKGGNRQAGLRRAVARTGGIITSCGVVMAGTFFSMTSAAWAPPLLEMFGLSDSLNRPPTLASITQLGFSLGLGVLLDTFYVRPILVPAYMALVDKWFGQKRSGGQPASEE